MTFGKATTKNNIAAQYRIPIKMIFSKDFQKLLIVCLKMLFRKSTRKRFVCLVVAFLFMIGFNTFSYVMKFHKTENLKKEVLAEDAFKIFFLRLNTKNDCAGFLAGHHKALQEHGAKIIKKAFIFQNNLYIHFFSLSEKKERQNEKEKNGLNLLYHMFQVDEFAHYFYENQNRNDYTIKVKNNYIDHNGARLNKNIIRRKEEALKSDLTDIADAAREGLTGKRFEVFNSIRESIVDNMKRLALNGNDKPNPYLSRLESIVPMNFLHILMNIRHDNTTDIEDLSESVIVRNDSAIETVESYLNVPEMYADKFMYEDIDEIFPRYLPVYIPDLLQLRWNWLLFQDIDMKTDLIDYIEQLHFKGHYMFSYEKLHIIRDMIKNINEAIHTNHKHFYWADLSLGIAFPFMMSLFTFIHLKTEIAFLLMFKNRIKVLLFIFWLLPVFLMLFVKGGVLSVYSLSLSSSESGLAAQLILPLSISFLFASTIFWSVNKWCFKEFTGNRINLYVLHKGR